METTDRSVSGIIAAFRASLNEFKSYRERRRKIKKKDGTAKHKALTVKKEDDGVSGDELKLSHSLRQGAVDVQREYERHFRVYGDQYAVGDSMAHSSLGQTLRRLNTCLHNIISSVLSCGQKDVRIDYKHLTSVSDLSRQEALEALSLLSFRMSQSALDIHQSKKDEKQCQARDAKDKARRKLAAKSESNLTERSTKSKSKNQPEVRKVHLKSATTPKLAMVRPKPKRASSSKSEVSSACSTPQPLPSPSPAYTPKRQTSPLGEAKHTQERAHRSKSSPPPKQNMYPPNRRRQDKITPSVYTIASVSTRLGEIPENRWAIPYDHEAMERLNRENAGKPWPIVADVAEKPKRGFWGMFKKSSAGKAVEVGA